MTAVAAPPLPVVREVLGPAPDPVAGVSSHPLPLPTRRCAWLVAVTSVPIVLGLVHPLFPLVGAIGVLVVALAAVADWLALPVGPQFFAVRLNRPVLSLGSEEQLPVDVELRATRSDALHMRLVDDLHPRLDRRADPEPATVDAISRAHFVTRARPRRRGRHVLGAVHVRVKSRVGLVERAVRFDLAMEVRVYPGVEGIARAARMIRYGLRQEAGLRRSRFRGLGTSFESLREYMPGEDLRKVDWKASARHAKLISRHYEIERSQNVLLLIDMGRWMTSEVAGLTRLDHVLNACVLLAHVAAMRDDRVGVLAFAEDVEAYVPPAKGHGAVERIIDAVFDLEPRLVESDYRRAFTYLASKHRKRSLIVLFTDVLGREASRVVVEETTRAARRHLPLAVTLRDADLDRLAADVPTNAAAVYRQAAAEELLLEREQALAVMRASGVHVLDGPPGSLGPALVDRYLELKARMLI